MKKSTRTLIILLILSVAFLSIPWLLPGTGWLLLVALVPLLCMEFIASQGGVRHFWWWHYLLFVLWNLVTTFWVGNATLGGAAFAILANAAQMSIIFSIFHASRKHLRGAVRYIFLAALWIAWERWYLTSAQISWPWLVLGNGFSRTLSLCQWYEYTGTLGGSLWVWASNIAIFLLMKSLAEGTWLTFNIKGKIAAAFASLAIIAGPCALSLYIYNTYEQQSEGKMDVLVAQPNFDPYHKFQAMSQAEQNQVLLSLFDQGMAEGDSSVLCLAPETFCSDVRLDDIEGGRTVTSIREWQKNHPGASVLLGASTHEYFQRRSRPSWTARELREGLWHQPHNSAIMLRSDSTNEIFHKSKLVVGVESMPYPRLFHSLDQKLGYVMGRDIGQDHVTALHFGDVTIGSAICYESIYGEYCSAYARSGARALAVITNDAWWGDTPGYVQHCSYSSLRAIELRRDIARCANTGVSCLIDQRGRIREATPYWERAVFRGSIDLNSKMTFFALNGDIAGRICVLVAVLLLLTCVVRMFGGRR